MIVSDTGAPKDYDELFVHYFPLIRSIVAKAGIRPVDVEDVSMDLLTRFIERDALSWYDPDKLHDVGDRPRLPGDKLRPARFQGLLRRFCGLYVRQHLDRQNLLQRREPRRLEDRVGEQTWIEAHGDRLAVDTVAVSQSAGEFSEDMGTAYHELRVESVEWQCISCRACLDGDRQARVHAERRSAEAARAARALRVAYGLAARDERVTATAVARETGWSPTTAGHALRTARAQLRSVS